MKLITAVALVSGLSVTLFTAAPSRAVEPPPARVDEIVAEVLGNIQAAGSLGALIHVSTPHWEGDWAWGTAELAAGGAPERPVELGNTFRIASVSKTFTATVVLQLVDEGVLSLEDTLDHFDEGFGVPEADRITVRQLLNHTSGLVDWDASTDFLSDVCALPPEEYPLIGYTPRRMVEMAVSVAPPWPPRGTHHYTDTNYILLGMIVEWALQSEVTGSRYHQEVRERILVPLGLEETVCPEDAAMPGQPMHTYWIPAEMIDDEGKPLCPSWADYTGYFDGTVYETSKEFGCGEIISTLGDLAIWCRALAKGDLISAESHREQLDFGPYHYGLGIEFLGGLIGHSGAIDIGYSSALYYLPSRDTTIVVLLNRSSPFTALFQALSLAREIFPIPRVDFNGDGTSDIAVFRGSSGLWAARGATRAYFGKAGDIPVPGDYSGDGTSDIAVFRESSGLWAVRGGTRAYFGKAGDIPVPGDYSGDGTSDIAVFRGSSGLWVARGATRAYFGKAGDIPVPGDYSGNGTDNIAIFRESSGLWAVKGATRFYFGRSGDLPSPGYYGDSFRLQPVVFRPGSGLWALRGLTRIHFGRDGDSPVPGDYQCFGGGLSAPAIFRPATGLWAIWGLTRIYFGTSGDLPVTR